MNLSINPSYFCNFSCDFCYLSPNQLKDQTKIDLTRLEELLAQVPIIDHVDLYGGEIGALKKEYFYGLKNSIRKYYSGDINIITNMSMLHNGFFDEDVYLSVSYDFEAREHSDKVFQNMMLSPVPIAVLVLASPAVIAMDPDYMISMLNACSAVDSVEIKPYSVNQANQLRVSHKDFEDFIIKWIESPVAKKFQFINEDKISAALSGKYNAFSDDHVYITPSGKFGVLEFDLNDREYFLELESYDEYTAWAEREKAGLCKVCRDCEYSGKCLTEHYRHAVDMTQSCNGYKGLLDRYKIQKL